GLDRGIVGSAAAAPRGASQLPLNCAPRAPTLAAMSQITDFHAHLYYDPAEVERAKAVAAEAQKRFGVAVGHFHLAPIGPHPRGSCQLTVPTEMFGDFARWAVLKRDGLTIFAHASTGDDRADHHDHVIWFGPSEPLNLAMFG
ncbi:MAG: DOPA 4,5-dioxygenase family protein, partial [Sphingomicrobium sp.]